MYPGRFAGGGVPSLISASNPVQIMPKVRLAGTVRGERDPNREIRARLLYTLFSRGWDIYNSNGDQRISLSNIERKIIEADAFVFQFYSGGILSDPSCGTQLDHGVLAVGYGGCGAHGRVDPGVAGAGAFPSGV